MVDADVLRSNAASEVHTKRTQEQDEGMPLDRENRKETALFCHTLRQERCGEKPLAYAQTLRETKKLT